MLTDQQTLDAITLGYEDRATELKGAGSPRDTSFLVLVVRAALALTNQRYGGHVIVGVDDSDPLGTNTGLSAEQVAEWLDFDTVTAKMSEYADPPLSINIAERKLPDDGRSLIVIEVAEFAGIPVLCKKEFSGKLVRGQLYTRSMAKPESSAFHTHNELREVLDLATQKGLHSFIAAAKGAGIDIGLPASTTDAEQYAVQEQDFLAHDDVVEIRQGAYIQVTIRPPAFEAARLQFGALLPTITQSQVRLRNKTWPWFQQEGYGQDWVSNGSVIRHYPEAWRLYQSGLFLDFAPIPNRYGLDADTFGGDDETVSGYLPVWLGPNRFVEAFAFAARILDATELNALEVSFEIGGIENWQLVVANSRRTSFHQDYVYRAPTWKSTPVVLTPEVAALGTRDLAIGPALELVARFGWSSATEESIRGMLTDSFGEV